MPLTKLSHGFTHLTLCKAGFTNRGANHLADALSNNPQIAKTLKTLNISDNQLRADENTVSTFQ